MITIQNGSAVPDSTDLVVAMADGEYADADLIMCAIRSNPGTPTAMYQAQYLKYGPMVYQYETPEALGAAIVALDPTSTHDAAQLFREEEARRLARAGGTLVPEGAAPAPDAILPEDAAKTPEAVKIEDAPAADVPDESGSVGTLPDSIPGTIPDPLFINDPTISQILAEPDPSVLDVSAPPPIVIPDLPDPTPTVLPAVDFSTTTPQ